MRFALIALLAAAAAGCDRGGQYCALGVEHEVMHTSSKELDAIDVVAQARQTVAFWSEPAGLFARRLDLGGKPIATSVRLAARCDGGLDAVADGDALELACLVHPLRDKPDDAGGVLVLRLRADLQIEHSE